MRLLLWAALGALAGTLDALHAAAGITTYPNPEWIGKALPFSPVYAAAGVLAYVGHSALAGPVAAGERVSPLRRARAVLEFVVAYAATAVLSAKGLENGPWPFVCAALLAAWAAPTLWRLRRTRFVRFAAVVAAVGAAFEWLAVSRGAFAHGICPSAACLGAPVALVWLPLLYLHAAILVRRLLCADGFG